MKLENHLSLVSVTHFAPRDSYGDLSPPSAGILQQTIDSFRNNITDLDKCDHIIVYNKPKDYLSNSKAQQYYNNIVRFADNMGNSKVISKENRGLGPGILEAVSRVETPYVLFVEHDWKMLRRIDIGGIIDSFEQCSNMNSVRFGRRPNMPEAWDTIVVEDLSKEIPLCKVSNVSNQPQITRTNVLKNWIKKSKPSILSILLSLYYHYSGPQTILSFIGASIDKLILRKRSVRFFDDVEKVLDTKYKHQIKREGFDSAHNYWGTYLYGNRGGGPYVEHLGR